MIPQPIGNAPWRGRSCATGLLVLTWSVFIAGHSVPTVVAAQARTVSTAGANLLRAAVLRPMPDYPPTSLLAGREGVVVTEVLMGADGRMRSVSVLQAPDEAIGSAITEALLQWTFKPFSAPGGAASGVRSKLVFYFVIREGQGRVLTFQEMADLRRAEEGGAEHTDVEPNYPVISEADWRRLVLTTKPLLLDIQGRADFGRGHLAGALNIPEAELYSRAPSELSRTRDIVIDCPRSVSELCPYAARILARAGYSKVSILRRP